MVRLVSSRHRGDDGARCALARGFTGRDMIVKFEGCYHGARRPLAGRRPARASRRSACPDSPGVPRGARRPTRWLPFNDLERGARALRASDGGEIAAVIVEPVVGNMGCVPPRAGFLQGLRELCAAARRAAHLRRGDDRLPRRARRRAGALRHRRPTSPPRQGHRRRPARRRLRRARATSWSRSRPLGPVYQAGTLSGNPLAMAAGIAMLELLAQPGTYERLERRTARSCARLRERAPSGRRPARRSTGVGSMWTCFFAPSRGVRLRDAPRRPTPRASAAFFHAHARRAACTWPPSQFEAAFVSWPTGRRKSGRRAAAFRSALAA